MRRGEQGRKGRGGESGDDIGEARGSVAAKRLRPKKGGSSEPQSRVGLPGITEKKNSEGLEKAVGRLQENSSCKGGKRPSWRSVNDKGRELAMREKGDER